MVCHTLNIMITLVYYVSPKEKDDELEWLRDQKIFPGVAEIWDWNTNLPMIKFGVIVSPEAALAIKLRHKLEIQTNYKQR